MVAFYSVPDCVKGMIKGVIKALCVEDPCGGDLLGDWAVRFACSDGAYGYGYASSFSSYDYTTVYTPTSSDVACGSAEVYNYGSEQQVLSFDPTTFQQINKATYATTWIIDPTCDEFSTCEAMEDLIALKTDDYCGEYASSTDSTDYAAGCELRIDCGPGDGDPTCYCSIEINVSYTYGAAPYTVDGDNLVLGGYYAGYEIPYCVDGDEVLLATDYDYGLIAERI